VIYMIIWKCCYYFKKYFIEVAKGRPYELFWKPKNIKILPNYSAIASSDIISDQIIWRKISHFQRSRFSEIAIFRSNPSKVGSE
jgi:hypothetical protein